MAVPKCEEQHFKADDNKLNLREIRNSEKLAEEGIGFMHRLPALRFTYTLAIVDPMIYMQFPQNNHNPLFQAFYILTHDVQQAILYI